MVTSDSPSTPPPQDGAVLPALSDGGSSGSAPSLKRGQKGDKKGCTEVWGSWGSISDGFAGKLAPCLPQLSSVLLVLVNYEACTHSDYDGSYYLKFKFRRPA